MKAVLFNRHSGELIQGGLELIDVERQGHQWLWLDMDGNEAEKETAILRERFHINPLAIVDALRTRHPPKIETFGEITFLLLRGLSADTTNIRYQTIQIALFIGKDFLVTRHSNVSL
ncbi:MAG: metal transporter, partial [Gammaproteobacteria bacterium]|nr:metal transporter [Gammaproteobacteria bacterium]